MSLNSPNGLQLYQGELIVQRHKKVEIKFKHVKYSSEHLKGTKTGELYLTNFRLFFVNDKNNDMLRNLGMPFRLIKDFEIKQPMFGANYLEGKILAEESGGWNGSAEFEITFKAGGAVEVGQELVKLAKNPQLMYFQPAVPLQPVYPPPSFGYQPEVPPMYSQSAYPAAPVPPPYPQVPSAPYSQPGDAKAQEAMNSASSYLPPGYTTSVDNPPPYDNTKKQQ